MLSQMIWHQNDRWQRAGEPTAELRHPQPQEGLALPPPRRTSAPGGWLVGRCYSCKISLLILPSRARPLLSARLHAEARTQNSLPPHSAAHPPAQPAPTTCTPFHACIHKLLSHIISPHMTMHHNSTMPMLLAGGANCPVWWLLVAVGGQPAEWLQAALAGAYPLPPNTQVLPHEA